MSDDTKRRANAETVAASDQTRRLRALRELDILDTPPEERFDRITALAVETFDVPIALVSLLDDTRQWFKSRQGIEAQETPLSVAFCLHAIQGDDTFVVPDATSDPRFAQNPLVLGEPNVRFYAGHPLHALDGTRIGTLCIIDRKPNALSQRAIDTLAEMASLVEDELSAGGLKLDDFALREVIGRGGMGVVYRAFDEALERDVAIKVIHRRLLRAPNARERFLREARALASVHHANVLTIFRVLRVGELHALVSELLRGGTWDARARREAVPDLESIVRIGAEVARGVRAVHAVGLVHRDIKPANVLFDLDGTAKLGDFGLARVSGPAAEPEPVRPASPPDPLPPARSPTSSSLSGLTEDGAIIGTHGFLAPELLDGGAATPGSDHYALGATLYAVLLGEAPAPGASTSVQAAGADVPDELDELIARLLSVDPDERPSIQTVVDELGRIHRRLA